MYSNEDEGSIRTMICVVKMSSNTTSDFLIEKSLSPMHKGCATALKLENVNQHFFIIKDHFSSAVMT